jgi:D-alanyl-D-alanine carboxypeptidase (penicillin-binding protein 5/6)
MLLAAPAPAAERAPSVDAAAWTLIDARDGDQLAARKPDRRRAIASTTKLMTAYLALREPMNRKLKVPSYNAAPVESVAGLTAGERLTVRDLVTAMMLPSANDAAATVAQGVSGSEAAFVGEMNDAAADLGLDGTSFANPIGLDAPDNYSTATDLAELGRVLREDKRFRAIVAQPEATLKSGAMPRTVVTRNTLLLSDPTVDGMKTGHTSQAGYVLVASAKRQGVPLISVVLGAGSEAGRDAASAELLDYGYSLYERRSPFRADEEMASVEVRYEDEPLALLAAESLPVQARADQKLAASVDAPAELEGPIERGEKLGEATVTLDGERVGRVPLVAAAAIAEPTIVDRVGGPWVVVGAVVLLVVILLLAALALRRRSHLRRTAESAPEERTMRRQERQRRRENGGGGE